MPPHHRPIKSKTLTLKVTNRRVLARPPTPDLSGDEGYSALEDLGDSDVDDENVSAAEEEHLLGLARIRTARSPRPVSDDDDDDVDEDVNADGDDEGEEVVDDDDDIMYEEDDDDGDESAGGSWHGFGTDNTESDGDMNPPFAAIHDFPPLERHVRFANLPDSDSDDTDTDDDHADMFPDIFVDQSTLDPAIRREIDRDPEESSGSNSFWDFHGGFEYSSAESDTDIFLPRSNVTTAPPTDDDATPTATPAPSHAGANLASGLSTPIRPLDMQVDLDGYESELLTSPPGGPKPPRPDVVTLEPSLRREVHIFLGPAMLMFRFFSLSQLMGTPQRKTYLSPSSEGRAAGRSRSTTTRIRTALLSSPTVGSLGWAGSTWISRIKSRSRCSIP